MKEYEELQKYIYIKKPFTIPTWSEMETSDYEKYVDMTRL